MRAPVAALGLVLMLVVSCSPASQTSGYQLTEFEISGPSRLSGEGGLQVTNSGDLPHTLVIADMSGQVVGATDLIRPGEATTLDVELGPGTYQFTCRIVAETPDGAIVDHFEAGMVETVVVED